MTPYTHTYNFFTLFKKMTFLRSVLVLIFCFFTLVSCTSLKSKKTIHALQTISGDFSVSISSDTTVFKVGSDANFEAVFSSLSETEEIEWKVLDEGIATINASGVMRPYTEGKTQIVVRSKATGEALAVYPFVIFKADSDALLVPEDGSDMFESGRPKRLDVDFGRSPSQNVRWSSEDTSIATVDPDTGEVTGYRPGTVRIVARSRNGEGRMVAYRDITIVDSGNIGFITSPDDSVLEIGETKTYTVTLADPEAYADETIVWTVDDESIAVVDSNGAVTGVSGGRTTVCAKLESGLTIGCESIVVVNPGDGIWLEFDSTRIPAGGSSQFTAVIPDELSGVDLTWRIVDTSIATVDDTGLVTWVSPGITTLEVYDGDTLLASVELSFDTFSVSIAPSGDDTTLEIGEIDTFLLTFTPADAAFPVTWESTDTDVATVSDGTVTAVAGGSTVIRIKDETGNVLGTPVSILVVKPGESVWVVSESPEPIEVNDTLQLSLVFPSDIDEDDIEWTVSDPSLASVSDSGLVTWRAGGETTVNAVLDGVVVGTYVVTLDDLITEVASDSGETSLYPLETLQFNVAFTPSGTGFSDYEWRVSDTSIASIDSDGRLTGESEGTTEVQLVHSITGLVLDAVEISVGSAAEALQLAYDDSPTLDGLWPLTQRVLETESDNPLAVFIEEIRDLASGLDEDETTFIESNLPIFKSLSDDGTELVNPISYESGEDLTEGSLSEFIEYGDLIYYGINDGADAGLYAFNLIDNSRTKVMDGKIGGVDIYGDYLYTSVLNDSGTASVNILNLLTLETGYRNDASLRDDLEVMNDDYIILVNNSQARIRVASKNVIDNALGSNWDGSYILDGTLFRDASGTSFEGEFDNFYLDSDGTNVAVLATEMSQSAWSGSLGGGFSMGLFLYGVDENDQLVFKDVVTFGFPLSNLPGRALFDYRYSAPKIKIHNGYIYASYPLGYFVIYSMSGGALTEVYKKTEKRLTTFDVSGDLLILNDPNYTNNTGSGGSGSTGQVTGSSVSVLLRAYDISDPSSLTLIKEVVSVEGANADSWGGSDVYITDSKVAVRVGNSMFTFDKSDLEE